MRARIALLFRGEGENGKCKTLQIAFFPIIRGGRVLSTSFEVTAVYDSSRGSRDIFLRKRGECASALLRLGALARLYFPEKSHYPVNLQWAPERPNVL